MVNTFLNKILEKLYGFNYYSCFLQCPSKYCNHNDDDDDDNEL